jgi:hypothetical protein
VKSGVLQSARIRMAIAGAGVSMNVRNGSRKRVGSNSGEIKFRKGDLETCHVLPDE